jgi:hypothetical protein
MGAVAVALTDDELAEIVVDSLAGRSRTFSFHETSYARSGDSVTATVTDGLGDVRFNFSISVAQAVYGVIVRDDGTATLITDLEHP